MEYHLIISNEANESLDLYTDEGVRLASNGFDGIGFSNEIISSKAHGYDGTVYQGSQLPQRTMSIMARYRGPTWKHEMHKNRLSRLVGEKQTLTIRYITPNIDVYIKGYAERVNTPPNVRPMITQISIICTDPYWRRSGDNTVLMAGTHKCWKFPISIAAVRPQTAMFLSDSGNIGNAVEYPVVGVNLYGKSIQNSTPTPEAPVDIVSVGDDGVAGVTACGKNLLNISVDLPLTAAGVTISRDSEGNIILNGTATSSYTFTLGEFNLPYNTYTLSINSKIQGVGIDCKNFATLRLADTIKTVTVESSGNDRFYCNVSSGITFDNFILNPQLEIGSTATDYEPYKGNTVAITSGLPLCSVGDVCDELIYNADGTGKIIKRFGKTVVDGINNKGYFMSYSESKNSTQWSFDVQSLHITPNTVWGNGICSHAEYGAFVGSDYTHFAPMLDGDKKYIRCWFIGIGATTTEELNTWLQSNPVTFIYQIEPQEIELSAAEMMALRALQTFDGAATIFNNEGAEMLIKYKGVIL